MIKNNSAFKRLKNKSLDLLSKYLIPRTILEYTEDGIKSYSSLDPYVYTNITIIIFKLNFLDKIKNSKLKNRLVINLFSKLKKDIKNYNNTKLTMCKSCVNYILKSFVASQFEDEKNIKICCFFNQQKTFTKKVYFSDIKIENRDKMLTLKEIQEIDITYENYFA